MTGAIETKSRRHDLQGRAKQLAALLRCIAVAEENETAGLDWKGLSGALELAEELAGEIADGIGTPPQSLAT